MDLNEPQPRVEVDSVDPNDVGQALSSDARPTCYQNFRFLPYTVAIAHAENPFCRSFIEGSVDIARNPR